MTCSPMPITVAQQPQQPLDHDGLCHRVISTFDLWASRSMHDKQPP